MPLTAVTHGRRLPTRKRFATVDALELTCQTVTLFTVWCRVPTAVAALQLIVDVAGELEF